MNWNLDKSKPLCPQICEQLCLKIACGMLQPNEKLPSVREFALSLGVNPNTVQRSFETLEAQRILYSVRCSGWFVAEDITPAKEVLQHTLHKKTVAYFAEMTALGMTTEDIKQYVKEWNDECISKM